MLPTLVNPEHWEQIKELFDAVVQLSAPEREEYLRQACEGHPTLKSEVERLLRATDAAGDFLTEPLVQPSASLQPGDLLANRYRVKRMLGRGGMGEVYEVEDEMLHEAVALKTLRVELALSETYLRRFKREIQLARKVTHPNVCRVFEVGEHKFDLGRPPVHFFTMELLPGETLSGRIRRLKKLSKDDAFGIAGQMADGLQAAHQAGIVHTDFKSGNVILCEGAAGERAVITDFGLARRDPSVSTGDQVETVTALHMAGTLGYMSPEQLTGGRITAASDIYSFGIVLFEMATGGLPFDNHHPINAAVQRMGGRALSAKSLVPGLDQRWAAAIARCLQPEPERRFASTKDLGDCFREGAWRSPVVHWSRREWIGSALTACAAIALIAGSWLWLTRPYQPLPESVQWYEKGVDALRSMTFESARRELESAVAADPKFALAHASLARAYDELDYSDLAKESMLRAVTAAQENRLGKEDALRLRALQYVVTHDYDRAAGVFRELEDRAGAADKASAAFETGWVAQVREDVDTAKSAFERSSKLNPTYAPARLWLAINQALRGRGAIDQALKAFSEAETLFSTSGNFEGVAQTYFQRASFLNRSGRAQDSLPAIERGLEIAATTQNAYQQIRLQLLQGVAYRSIGESDRARDTARRAIESALQRHVETAATNGMIDLANAFFLRGEPAPAEEYFRLALEFAQRNRSRRNEARGRLAYGSFLVQYHRPAEAEEFIQAALVFYRQSRYPRELTQGSLLMGGIYRQRSQIALSEKILREGVAAANQLPDVELTGQAAFSLANTLVSAGRWPEALAEFKRTSRLFSNPLRVAYAVLDAADLQWRLGDLAGAQSSFDQVSALLAKIQGDQAQLRSRYFQYRAAMAYGTGKFEEARKLALEAVKEGEKQRGVETIESQLLAGISQIRLGQVAEGLAWCEKILKRYREGQDRFGLASAELAVGQALLIANQHKQAEDLARPALQFFESLNLWEAVWRCKWILARTSSGSTEPVRAALDKLRELWPAESFQGYWEIEKKKDAALNGVFTY